GRGVVVLGGDRQVGATHRAPREPEPLEGLRARDLVHEVQVDEEQVGSAVLAAAHEVRLPDLFCQSASHDGPVPFLHFARKCEVLNNPCRQTCVSSTETAISTYGQL